MVSTHVHATARQPHAPHGSLGTTTSLHGPAVCQYMWELSGSRNARPLCLLHHPTAAVRHRAGDGIRPVAEMIVIIKQQALGA